VSGPVKLSGVLRRAIGVLAQVVCAPERPPAPATLEAVADEVERFLGSIPGVARLGITSALWTLEVSTATRWSARGRTFSRLDPERAAAVFARWWSNPALHPLAKVLKMVVAFAWWELPEVQKDMGYDPASWIEQSARRRRAAWAEEIRHAEAAVLAPDPLRPREEAEADAVARR
jgi:hypothetical protein